MTMNDTLVPFTEAMARYEPVIGLETHVELGTRTKMFCGCTHHVRRRAEQPGVPGLPRPARLAAGDEPDGDRVRDPDRPGAELLDRHLVPVRPEELLLPGHAEELPDLPVRRAAVHRRLPGRDPRAAGTVRVGIERVHLEEDTGKSLHVGGATGRIHGADYSLVDYNRAGIPLVEIVTKPIEGTGANAPEVARAYVTELRDLVRSLGVSDVRMEEGSLRCDVNTSLAPRGSGRWGTRTETKNVNSLRSVERAVRFEIERQAAVLDAGGRVIQETRHFHEDTGTTTSGRSKEEAQDYRYFPEPDLVPVAPPAEWVEQIRAALPEAPSARRARLQAEWDLSDLEMTALTNAGALDLVAETVAAGASPADARKWWLGELARRANEAGIELSALAITPAQVARVAELTRIRRAQRPAGPRRDRRVLAGEGDPDQVVAARGLAVVSDDGALGAAVDEAIAAHPDVAAKVREGKIAAVGPLVGAVMKATGGQADAARVRQLILDRLS